MATPVAKKGTKKASVSPQGDGTVANPATTNNGSRTQAFHDFYSQIFTPKRWERLYQALSEPTDLVALINPYVPPRWIAKELGGVNAVHTNAFKSSFTKGLPIFQLPKKSTTTPTQRSGMVNTTNNINNDKDEAAIDNAMDSIEDKGFVSRWPVKLPQVGHQTGDNQLDIALAQQSDMDKLATGTDGMPIDTDSEDDNPFQGEHIALAGGYVSGFGPTRDKMGWYLMDLASIAAPLILNPQPGEKVLDLCAAPGGKSLILAYLMLFRDQLQQRNAAITDTMARFQDVSRLNAQHNAKSSQYTTFEEETSLSVNDEINTMFSQNTLLEQNMDDFSELTRPVDVSTKKLNRMLARFDDLYDDDDFMTSALDDNNNNIPLNDNDGVDTNNAANVSNNKAKKIKSRVSYENDEIILAIYTARNHISTLKTKNELDRDRFLEKQRAIELAKENKANNNAQKPEVIGQCGDYDDDNDIYDVPNQKNAKVDPDGDAEVNVAVELVSDLQYERDLRNLHSKILNPLALRQQMDISETSSDDDDSDEEREEDFKVKANQILTAGGGVKDLNKKTPTWTPPTEEEIKQRQARRQAKLELKQQHEREKEQRRLQRQKVSALRLRSRLVLNDVSIPRVKRLQRVIQSYLPMKYIPLIEITNVDASTAQQFTLVTRNSQGDVSVKKIQKKGTGSALHSADIQQRAKEGEYDAVLVDAPCSSDRHIIHDDALASWSVAYTKAQAKRQYGLLLAAMKSLKVGGRCVYSTCSLSPFENDGVVQQVVKTLGEDVVKVIKFKLDIGEKTGLGWILLPDQPNCAWGPLYISLLQRIG